MKKIILSHFLLIISFFVFAQKEKLPVIKSPVFKKDTFSIKKYGAVADGYFLNTQSIRWVAELKNIDKKI